MEMTYGRVRESENGSNGMTRSKQQRGEMGEKKRTVSRTGVKL